MFDVQASIGPAHILRPDFGSDLLKELQTVRRGQEHQSGLALGSRRGLAGGHPLLRPADSKEWVDLELDKRLEVAGMWGNVSLLNGEPIVHVHIVLADETGRCYGGHLADGTLVFNLEIMMTTLHGPNVVRKMDSQTGLTIWH